MAKGQVVLWILCFSS